MFFKIPKNLAWKNLPNEWLKGGRSSNLSCYCSHYSAFILGGIYFKDIWVFGILLLRDMQSKRPIPRIFLSGDVLEAEWKNLRECG